MSQTLQMQDLVLAAQGIPELPVEKQKVWNLIGQGKMAMDQGLQKSVLVIQTHLATYTTMDQATLDKAITAYKNTFKEIVETRMKFTSFLDAAKDMCMAVERSWDPKTNETFKLACAREIELREAAHKVANAATAKATEEQMFRAFCVNEFHDMVTGYRLALLQIIQQAYTACLTQRTPVENVGPALQAAVAAMREILPRVMGKYDKKYMTDAEAMKIFESVQKPNWQNLFNEAIESLKAKFNLYGNDLANAEGALVKQAEIFTQETTQVSQQAQAEQAATTLLAQGTIPTVTPAGMKPITETSCIEIPTVLDWVWELTIIAAFLGNAKECAFKVRTKKGGALTTEQMAKALDACGVKVDGVKYAEIKK